jgi:hypothetical protein
MSHITTHKLLGQLPGDPHRWARHLCSLANNRVKRLAAAIAREWARGWLDSLLAGTRDPVALRPIRRVLAHTFSELRQRRGITPEIYLRPLVLDKETAHRWCWIQPWFMEQENEDLSFICFEPGFIQPLLEEAQAGAPKAAYAVSIVAHRIRDQAHGVLCEDCKNLPGHLAGLSSVESLARHCGFAELADYCGRLAAYSQRLPVGREEAIARALDLRCCSPEAPRRIMENKAYFHLFMDEYRGEWLVVDRIHGQMRMQRTPGY